MREATGHQPPPAPCRSEPAPGRWGGGHCSTDMGWPRPWAAVAGGLPPRPAIHPRVEEPVLPLGSDGLGGRGMNTLPGPMPASLAPSCLLAHGVGFHFHRDCGAPGHRQGGTEGQVILGLPVGLTEESLRAGFQGHARAQV